jgi:anti-sigma B factor antagonist
MVMASSPLSAIVSSLMDEIDYHWSDGYNHTTLKTNSRRIHSSEGAMITIAEEQNGETTIVDINGRVDSSTAKSFEDRLTGLFQSGRNSVMVDFKHLVFISSAGCRALLVATRLAQKNGCRLALCNITAEVMRVLELGGMTDFFVIYPSREEGLAKLA